MKARSSGQAPAAARALNGGALKVHSATNHLYGHTTARTSTPPPSTCTITHILTISTLSILAHVGSESTPKIITYWSHPAFILVSVDMMCVWLWLLFLLLSFTYYNIGCPILLSLFVPRSIRVARTMSTEIGMCGMLEKKGTHIYW